MTGLIRAAMFAAILLALPAGALSSAASHGNAVISENDPFDTYRPGQDGVDFAAITGPKGSYDGRLPACADPVRRGNLRPC